MEEDYVKALQELRAYVVEARRTSAIAIGDKGGRIKHIIECQEALRAIDEAIAEESKLAQSAEGLANTMIA